MAATNIGAGITRTTRLDLSGTDTLTIATTGAISVSANAQSVRFNGPTSAGDIDNAGSIINTASGGRAIRIETSVGSNFTATITNHATGIIQAGDDAVQIQAGSVTAGTLTFANAGSVTSAVGQALDLAGGTLAFVANITNTGTLGSGTNDAVRFGGASNTLTNTGGTINGGTASGYAQGADGVQFDAVGSGGTVTNENGGAISGDRHGINATTGTVVTVTNDATSTITGRNGSGVGLDGSGSIINYGTITGAFSDSAGSDVNGTTVGAVNGGGPDGINDGDGDGIDIDGQATIDNYGLIQGTGAGGSGSDGRLNTSEGIAAGGGSITNRAGATIQGLGLGILIDDSSTGPAPFVTTVTNLGTVTGTNSYAIRIIGAQNDVVDNGGAISGGGGLAIALGGGNDALILRNGSSITGTANGEGGTDTLDYGNWAGSGVAANLATGAATGTGGVTNFEGVIGSAQADRLTGGSAAETLQGGGGNDTIDGGDGSDTAIFSGTQAQARFGIRDNVLIANGPDGLDQLSNIELLTFGAAAAVSIASIAASADNVGLFYANLGGTIGYVLGDAYAGPVAGLVNQQLGTAATDTVLGTDRADFINALGGDDAVNGGAGNDMIDGGLGSNFLTGGAGLDIFFIDGRGAALANTWSTITDFGPGEQVTIWGYKPGISVFLWLPSDGTPGYTGATLHADLDGNGLIDTSVTWSGLSQAQLPVAQYGTDYIFFG